MEDGGGEQGGGRLLEENPQRKLVSGGTPVPRGEYPFMAEVLFNSVWNEETNSTDLEVACQGVMVANDVILAPKWCFMTDTVLVRGAMLSDMEVNLLPGYLTSPDDRFSVYKTDPVTSLGSLPVPLERNVNEPREGQNVTVVGYGSNSSWNAVDVEDGDYSYTYPGAAMEAQLQVMSHEYCDLSLMNLKLDYATEFCAVAPQENFPFNFRAAGPCLGDEGAPVLDSNGTLVGMVLTTECGNMAAPSAISRISSYSDWILEATCALTDDNESQLCPEMVCPPAERVLGYPWAKVPDASGGTKTFHGYTPQRVAQSPLAGTPFNSTTTVLVLAVDESDLVALCAWTLYFPEITDLGETYEDLPSGNYDLSSSFPSDVMYDGLAVYLTVQLGQSLEDGATVAVTAGNNETLTLSGGDSYGELWFETQYNPRDLNDTSIAIAVSGMQVPNSISVSLLGQVKHCVGG